MGLAYAQLLTLTHALAPAVNPLSPIVEHAYKFEGTYSACLVVNNGELSSAPTCVDVVVSNRTQFGEGPNLVRVCSWWGRPLR